MNITDLTRDDIDHLSLQAISSKPRSYTWDGEALTEDEWTYWEAFTYQGGAGDFVLIANHSGIERAYLNDKLYASDEYDDYIYDAGAEDDDPPTDLLTQEAFDALFEVEPYQWGSEGPMMNYWYPLDEQVSQYSSFSPIDAALALRNVPLCVVEVDGEYGMALTGGGMDFTDRIVEGFLHLGMLPPVHFANLDIGPGAWQEARPLVLAMKRSLQCMIDRLGYDVERLDRYASSTTGYDPEGRG